MKEIILTQILIEGNTNGIIQIDVDEWNGMAYKIPKNRFREVNKIDNLKKCGIYFLIKKSNNKNIVYIGKSSNVYNRILKHNKKFWQECIVFISKNYEINEAHTTYIESIICKEAKSTGNYIVENEQIPQKNILSNADRIKAIKFLDKVKIVIDLLGYEIFDK